VAEDFVAWPMTEL